MIEIQVRPVTDGIGGRHGQPADARLHQAEVRLVAVTVAVQIAG